MKRAGWWALAALVVVAAISPLSVKAQTGTNGTKANTLTGAPIIYYESDSTRRVVSTGQGMPITEVSPDRSWYFHYQQAIGPKSLYGDSVVASRGRDSTSVLSTLGAGQLMLGIYVVPDSATAGLTNLSKILLMVQARACVTDAADSASCGPISQVTNTNNAASAWVPNQNTSYSDGLYAHGTPNAFGSLRLRGEFPVVASIARAGASGWTYVPVTLEGFKSAPPRMSFRVRYVGQITSAGAWQGVAQVDKIKLTMDVWGWR